MRMYQSLNSTGLKDLYMETKVPVRTCKGSNVDGGFRVLREEGREGDMERGIPMPLVEPEASKIPLPNNEFYLPTKTIMYFN